MSNQEPEIPEPEKSNPPLVDDPVPSGKPAPPTPTT